MCSRVHAWKYMCAHACGDQRTALCVVSLSLFMSTPLFLFWGKISHWFGANLTVQWLACLGLTSAGIQATTSEFWRQKFSDWVTCSALNKLIFEYVICLAMWLLFYVCFQNFMHWVLCLHHLQNLSSFFPSCTSVHLIPSQIHDLSLFSYYCYICVCICAYAYIYTCTVVLVHLVLIMWPLGIAWVIRKLVLERTDSSFLSSHGFLATLHLDVGSCKSSPVRVSMSASVIVLLLFRWSYCWEFMDAAGVFVLWLLQSFFPFFCKFPWHLGRGITL